MDTPANPSLDFMARSFSRGEASPQELFDVFLAATVYCQRPDRPGFLAIGEENAGAIPVFSSLEFLGRYAGECNWFSTTGEDLLDLLPTGYDLLLDATGPHPLRLNSAAWRSRPGLQMHFGAKRTEVRNE